MLKDNIIWPDHRRFISNKEWEPIYFFSECLCNSRKFDLSLGFFSSTAIRTLSYSFATFLYNGGQLRLIINNILSEDDKQTILRGENGEFSKSFDLSNIQQIQQSLSSYDQQFFDCLAWLIANDRIEIVVIEPQGGHGIAHTKSGVFYDGQNHVCFNGSCNFTKTALLDNIESIDAYCDWDGGVMVAKIEDVIDDFEAKFNKTDTTVKYIDAQDVICSIQKFFRTKPMSELLSQEKELIEKELNDASPSIAYRPSVKWALDRAKEKLSTVVEEERRTRDFPKFPFPNGPKDYQTEAFVSWKNNGQKGLFAMATGTGKTITSLNCLLEIYKKSGYYKAIVLVPTITLVNQWEKECRRFKFNNIIKVYSKNSGWKSDVDSILLQERIGGSNNHISYVIISTYASFAKDNVFACLNVLPKTKVLLIADEAHNMGSGSIRRKLPMISPLRRIGLSATPDRQYDEEGSAELLKFFGAETEYTYEYSMEKAIQNEVLCRYEYYPHIVRLTPVEMGEYGELSKRIAKYSHNGEMDLKNNEPLKALLLARKRIIHKASNKLSVFKEIVSKRYNLSQSIKYTLVYVPEGIMPDDNTADIFETREEIIDDPNSDKLIDTYTEVIRDLGSTITVKKFTSNTTDRDKILADFATGRLNVLTSMKCLDEGVDVPRSEFAIFCASTGNPRQFIQRRGRILRTHRAKHRAYIHDLVVVPDLDPTMESYDMERNMLKSELARVSNFAQLSENPNETDRVLDPILEYYNLSLFKI